MLIPHENSEAGRCDNNSARHPKSQNREKRCPVSCNLVMSSVESCRVICRLTTSHVVSRRDSRRTIPWKAAAEVFGTSDEVAATPGAWGL